jgi:transcriptional regulator with XRE-family HTH domain
MPHHDERWQAVGEAITARISHLRMTTQEVIRASGVSFKTLDRYKSGQPIVRVDKARDLARALQWPDDAVARLLAGDDPESLPPASSAVIAAIMADPLLDEASRQVLVGAYEQAIRH